LDLLVKNRLNEVLLSLLINRVLKILIIWVNYSVSCSIWSLSIRLRMLYLGINLLSWFYGGVFCNNMLSWYGVSCLNWKSIINWRVIYESGWMFTSYVVRYYAFSKDRFSQSSSWLLILLLSYNTCLQRCWFHEILLLVRR